MTDIEYITAYEARHHSYERKALGIVRKVFAAQKRDIINYIKDNGIANLNIAVNALIKTHPLQEAFVKIYSYVGEAEGKAEILAFNELVTTRQKAAGVNFSDAEWRNQMVDYMLLKAGTRISGISETTREKIKFLLALAQEQNLSTDETVKFLLAEIRSPEFPAFSRARAMAIARTESTTAANAGSLLAGDSLTIQYEKKWVSARDDRTRRTPRDKYDHLVMNGVKVGPNQTFSVSGDEMQSPGDPTASKGNVINCRCIVRLTPVYDANGMPVPKVPVMNRFAMA